MVDNKENYKFDLGVKGLMYLSSSIQIVTWHLQLKMTRVMSKLVLQTFKQGSCTCFELNFFISLHEDYCFRTLFYLSKTCQYTLKPTSLF